MKFAVDWFAVVPGEIYPRMFLAGADCPPALADDAERAGVLAVGAAAEPEAKPRRRGRQ